MNLDNRVNAPGSSINQTSVSKKSGHNVGSLSKYGETAPLRQISVNQVIRGEITDLRNKEITITLADGTTVNGKLQNGSKLSIGNTAAFRITSVSPQVTIEALAAKESQLEKATIQKALESAGLPKNAKNQLVVRELINHNMPINKQSILNILKQSYEFKGAGIRSLVLMNQHDIPLTLENVTQFEKYQNMEHQLIKGVGTFADSLPALLQTLAEGSSPSAVASFGSQLMEILFPGENAAPVPQNKDIAFLSESERESLLNLFHPDTLSTGDALSLLSGDMSLKEVIARFNMDSEDTPVLNQGALEHPVAEKLLLEQKEIQRQNNEIASLLDNNQRSELKEALKDFPLSEEFKNQISSGDINAQEVISTIKKAISLTPAKSVINLFKENSFLTLFKEEIISNWTVTPKHLEKKGTMDDFYEKLYTQTKQLDQFFKNTLGSTDIGSSLSQQAKDMHQNMDFMQTLNQMFAYVQIPLKLKEQNVHSELYVYTKKNALKKNPNDISILLHLDMEKLGPLDIYLSLNQTQVTSKFYLSGKTAKNLFKDHIKELSAALQEKGYSINTEFFTREKEIDLVKDFIEQDGKNASPARYTFDIRA